MEKSTEMQCLQIKVKKRPKMKTDIYCGLMGRHRLWGTVSDN